MKLKVIEVNYTILYNWLFKLINDGGQNYFVMNEEFYKRHNLKDPVTKKELDSILVGDWVEANVLEINEVMIIKDIINIEKATENM